MKKQRNDCEFCENFIRAEYIDRVCKCKLGKQVRYQIPKPANKYIGGFYTYCESYKLFT
ncbi:hypothetical protein CCP3SC1AL1_1620011 [Gammaproteobacteria bacterium]